MTTQASHRRRGLRTQAESAGTHATPLSTPQGVSYALRQTPVDCATCGDFVAYDGSPKRMNGGGA